MATETGAEAQGQLAAQDDTRVLNRLFTGHLVAGHGFSNSAIVAAKVTAATATTVTVTITGFATPAGYTPTTTCYYEPKPQASGSTKKPPVGTACFVAFPANEPQKVGIVVAFIGWP